MSCGVMVIGSHVDFSPEYRKNQLSNDRYQLWYVNYVTLERELKKSCNYILTQFNPSPSPSTCFHLVHFSSELTESMASLSKKTSSIKKEDFFFFLTYCIFIN